MRLLTVFERSQFLRRLAASLAAALALSLFFGAASGSAYAQAPKVLTGVFTITYGDTRPQQKGPGQTLYRLFDDAGRDTRLLLDEELAEPYGGVNALRGRRVRVTAAPASTGDGADGAGPGPGAASEVAVVAIEPVTPSGAGGAQGAASAGTPSPPQSIVPVSGPVQWANILCKFADYPTTEPDPPSYFDWLFGSAPPGINDFWNKVSYGQVNVTADTYGSGSGWYTLPEDRAWYFRVSRTDPSPTSHINLTLLSEDCTGVADADVNFVIYDGINLMFNTLLDCCAWGGQQVVGADSAGLKSMTWQPPFSYENPAGVAHEMGHGLGLPHSNNSDGDDDTYDNAWDIMSGLWFDCPFYTGNPAVRCGERGTNAYHLDSLGWIAPGQKYTASAGVLKTLTLDALDQQTIGPGDYRMAQIGLSSTTFYTVEARRRAGDYDSRLPGDGVIINEVKPSRLEPAWVIGAATQTGFQTVTTTGAIFAPGQTYRIPDRFWVQVDSATANGFQVTLFPAVVPAVTTQAPKGRTGDTTPTFQWTPSPGADRYLLTVRRGSKVIFRQTYSAIDAACAASCSVSSSSTPPTPTLKNGAYRFTVRPMNPFASGPQSKARSFKVDTAPPRPPAPIVPVHGLAVTASPTLKVRKSASAVAYRFALDDSADCKSPVLVSSEQPVPRYTPPGLVPASYFWCAQARDSVGNWSAWGAAAWFVLAPP